MASSARAIRVVIVLLSGLAYIVEPLAVLAEAGMSAMAAGATLALGAALIDDPPPRETARGRLYRRYRVVAQCGGRGSDHRDRKPAFSRRGRGDRRTHPCSTTSTTAASSNSPPTSRASGGCPTPMPAPPPIRSFAAPP